MISATLLVMNHREWRKIAKKERRRRIRIKNAMVLCEVEKKEQERKQSSPTFVKWLVESQHLETMRIVEEDRLRGEANEKWLETEEIAQKQWCELQVKIFKAKEERAEMDLKIRQEWENEQKKVKEAQEKILRAKLEMEMAQKELDQKIIDYLNGNGDIPQEFLAIVDTKPHMELCPFYSKTGVCRFGNDCSRNHRKPCTGKILLAQNFYTNFGIEHSKPNEYDTDVFLEYEDLDTYRDFKEFFHDVLPEFEKFGKIVQFKVCSNRERHLRGNTYIEFARTRSAIKAHRAMHTRWYGGRQLSLQFCSIPSWRSAICGLANGNRCPKGLSCNFLHVFRNPGNRFDLPRNQSSRHSQRSTSRRSNSSPPRKENRRNWRWSQSPDIELPLKKANKRSIRANGHEMKENHQNSNYKRRKS